MNPNESFFDGTFKIKEIINLNLEENQIHSLQCVYGIVQSVYESKLTKFKHIHLTDDSCSDGIYINIKKFLDKISVRSIIKINSLVITKIAGKIEYFFDHHSSATFLPLFAYDYDNLEANERNKKLTETYFQDTQDRAAAKKLEEWYSLKIFETNLSNINEANSYFNLACQVLCYTKSSSCISALIWDGTNPNYSLPTCIYNDPNESSPLHFDGFNFNYFPFTLGRYFLFNVWKKDSIFSNEHYEIFKCLSLQKGDDLLVLFNIQLVPSPFNPSACSLAMRSTMKCGKAVRLCNRNSILGKLLMKRIEASIESFKQAICPDSVNDLSLNSTSQIDENKSSEEATEIYFQFQEYENNSQEQDETVEKDLKELTEKISKRAAEVTRENLESVKNRLKRIEERVIEVNGQEEEDVEEVINFSCGSSKELKALKEKGKPFIVYERLLKMGLPSLHEYYKLQEKEEYQDNFYPITKEERLKLIQYAINELRYQLDKKSSPNSNGSISISISNSYDSLMSEELETF